MLLAMAMTKTGRWGTGCVGQSLAPSIAARQIYLVYLNTSVYTNMTQDHRRLGTCMQVLPGNILLTISQNTPVYIEGNPHE
jgi:hypothetical protein